MPRGDILAGPLLLQHVFSEIYDLLEAVAILAEFNDNAECLSNESSIRVIDNGFRERSIVQDVPAMRHRKLRLCRSQTRVLVGVKKCFPVNTLICFDHRMDCSSPSPLVF